ncbi:MAG TPA: hypothetical protein VF480_12270 [Verrucomicrobiae bacterium]
MMRVVRELPRVPVRYLKKLEGREDLWEVRAEFGGTPSGCWVSGMPDG